MTTVMVGEGSGGVEFPDVTQQMRRTMRDCSSTHQCALPGTRRKRGPPGAESIQNVQRETVGVGVVWE
jgi:hypothetical protein